MTQPNEALRDALETLRLRHLDAKGPELSCKGLLDYIATHGPALGLGVTSKLYPLRWCFAQGDTIGEMRDNFHKNSNDLGGDTRLVWANEGDLYSHSSMLSVPSANPAPQKPFDKINEGLTEALAIAKGEAEPAKWHEPKPQARKVVQIATDQISLTALCDDGTIWNYRHLEWKQLPPIPGDAP